MEKNFLNFFRAHESSHPSNFEAFLLASQRSDCDNDSLLALFEAVRDVADVPGNIAECGSYKCGSTIILAQATPWKSVFAFDLFGGLPYPNTTDFSNFGDADFDEIRKVIAPWPNIFLQRGRHEDTVPRFPVQPLSFVFMDSDFYASHVVCLKHFWPMLSSGGSIVFHDWFFPSVRQAVHEMIPSDTAYCGLLEGTHNMGLIRKK